MWIRKLLMAAFVAAFAVPAFAQAPAPTGTPMVIRGVIEKLDGTTLTIKSREGQEVTVMLADPADVRGVKRVRLSAIKAGDHLGIAALADAGGKLRAQSVTLFPDWTHVTDGQRPWDLTPDSIMTNGTVGQVTKASRNRVLQVQYGDKSVEIEVAPGTPIVTYVKGTTRELRAGRAVTVFARKMADGSVVANVTVVQRGKVKPPM
jgi:hypothetical protein